MKHSFECLILLLKGISILRDIWDQSWRNFMLIKTAYPNFLHGSDFFCFLLIYLFIYLFINFAKDKLAGEISQN